MKFEGAVLVFGHRACADVDAQRREDHRGGVPVVDEKAGALVAVQRPLGQHLRAEKAKLGAAVPLVLVSVAEAQIEDGGCAVAKLCRERCSEEVRVGERLVVDDGHRSPARSGHREVVGVGEVHAFHAPQHARGAVAAHDDVVAGIVRALDPREVARHAGRVASGSGVAVSFFDREGAGAHRRHFVHHFAVLRGRHLRGLHGDDTLLKLNAQHDWTAAGHHDPLEHAGFVANERHLQGVAAERHVFEFETSIEVGRGDKVRGRQHLDGGAKQRIACFGIDNRARD